MKNLLLIPFLIFGLVACNSSYKATDTGMAETDMTENDTVKIVNEDVEYEIIIIEPGYNNWLQSRAKPPGYYTQQWLETRNIIYVTEWNNRVLDPSRFDPLLYQMQIDYNPSIDYGYDVNYQLYYYFIYFQRKYKQRLAGFVPRI